MSEYDRILASDERYQSARRRGKSGGAYSGWRPRYRSRWHYLGLVPWAALVLALTLKVFQ